MKKILGFFKMIGGLALPMFARARDVRKLSPAVRWLLHVAVLATLLVALVVLFNVTGLRKVISGDRRGLIEATWPALMLLALYALCWVGWWIYQILMEPPPASRFPDIDAAWEDALRALAAAKIDLTEAPLFLVLGRPEAPEREFFDAAQLGFKVDGAPREPDSPLRAYAHREGIYVSCAGASALGLQASLFAGDAHLADASSASGRPGRSYEEDDSRTMSGGTFAFEGRTNDPREIDQWIKIKEFMNRMKAQGRDLADLSPEERAELDRLGGAAASGGGGPASRPMLHRSPRELEVASARFRHLCRLVVRDRRPYCPVNGLLALVPLAATDSEDLAAEVASCLQDDLAVAREELRVNCPTFAVMCDLEKVPGYAEMTARLPKQALHQRMGQRFPFAPEVAPEEVPAQIEAAVRHIGDSFFPNLVSTLWRVEDDPSGEEAATRDNVQLFRFLSDIRERQRKLARINARALGRLPDGGPVMFGGCYLAGTRRQGQNGPAFVRGVFQRVAKQQEDVSWTRAALDDDARSERRAGVGYLALAALVAAFLLGGGYLLADKFSGGGAPEAEADRAVDDAG